MTFNEPAKWLLVFSLAVQIALLAYMMVDIVRCRRAKSRARQEASQKANKERLSRRVQTLATGYPNSDRR